MTGYGLVNLKDMIQELGEGRTKEILSEFSCPLNKDVEFFLHCKAIEFARQGIAQTQLVVTSYKDKPGRAFCLPLRLETAGGVCAFIKQGAPGGELLEKCAITLLPRGYHQSVQLCSDRSRELYGQYASYLRATGRLPLY